MASLTSIVKKGFKKVTDRKNDNASSPRQPRTRTRRTKSILATRNTKSLLEAKNASAATQRISNIQTNVRNLLNAEAANTNDPSLGPYVLIQALRNLEDFMGYMNRYGVTVFDGNGAVDSSGIMRQILTGIDADNGSKLMLIATNIANVVSNTAELFDLSVGDQSRDMLELMLEREINDYRVFKRDFEAEFARINERSKRQDIIINSARTLFRNYVQQLTALAVFAEGYNRRGLGHLLPRELKTIVSEFKKEEPKWSDIYQKLFLSNSRLFGSSSPASNFLGKLAAYYRTANLIRSTGHSRYSLPNFDSTHSILTAIGWQIPGTGASFRDIDRLYYGGSASSSGREQNTSPTPAARPAPPSYSAPRAAPRPAARPAAPSYNAPRAASRPTAAAPQPPYSGTLPISHGPTSRAAPSSNAPHELNQGAQGQENGPEEYLVLVQQIQRELNHGEIAPSSIKDLADIVNSRNIPERLVSNTLPNMINRISDPDVRDQFIHHIRDNYNQGEPIRRYVV